MSDQGRSVSTQNSKNKKKKEIKDPKATLDQIVKTNEMIKEQIKKNEKSGDQIDSNAENMKMEDQSNAIISAMNSLQKSLGNINEEKPNIFENDET